MSRDLALDLERITLEQATERARRSRSHLDRRGAALPCRVLAVTPCGEGAPDLEVVAEAHNYAEAIAQGSARVYSRSRFDSVAALVLVAEGDAAPHTETRPSEHPERLSVALAVGITLEPHPRLRASIVNARTLERLEDGGSSDADSPLAAMLEKVALAAEPLRATRRRLGIDAEG